MGPSAVKVTNLSHDLVPVADVAHGKIDVTGTVLDVTAATLVLGDRCTNLFVQIETAPVRLVLNDATTPDATTGLRYDEGAELMLSRQEWLASQWIREGATSAVLQVVQLGRP